MQVAMHFELPAPTIGFEQSQGIDMSPSNGHSDSSGSPNHDFRECFQKICIPEILKEADREPLIWQGRPLSWEVCHEILACFLFTRGKYSIERLIELSNSRYHLLNQILPGKFPTQEQLKQFYIKSAEILPWGHGVFVADHNVTERRANWLRRFNILHVLKGMSVESLVDYGAGGGHTTLLAKAMGFNRVIHHEYEVFNPYVLWRSQFIHATGQPDSTFITTDAAQPLCLSKPVQAIICTDVAENVFSPERMMQEIRDSMQPNGFMVWVSKFGEDIFNHLHGELAGKEETWLREQGFVRIGDLPAKYQGYTGLFQFKAAFTKVFCPGGITSGTAVSSSPPLPFPTPAEYAASEAICESPAGEPAFTSPAEVYLASADRMDRVLGNLVQLSREVPLSLDCYATVIGGLSGLNYLLAFRPKRILFFDINRTALEYARLIIEMIGLATSHHDFIGRMFARPVNKFLREAAEAELTFQNQEEYLSGPVNESLLEDTLSRLSPRARKTYEDFVGPHLSRRILDGARNCRRLLPCWPLDQRVPVGGGADLGYDEFGKLTPNTNTFFHGFGWLESIKSFSIVKHTLAEANLQISEIDLLKQGISGLIEYSSSLVLHVSNIDDWFPDEWPGLVHGWKAGALQEQCSLTIVTSHNGLQTLRADPHEWSYAALKPYVLGNVVEVTHKIPWGFHEFPRTNVTVDQYLDGIFPADTTILHILLGEGIDRQRFMRAYRKALTQSRRLIVMEHNRLSADWGDDPPARFVTKSELHHLLMDSVDGLKPQLVTSKYLQGEKDGRRNLMMVMDISAAETNHRPSAVGMQPGPGQHGRRNNSNQDHRPRVLLVADVPNWIFARHCLMLKHHLSDEFDFTVIHRGQPFGEHDFDLIYPLEWNLVEPHLIHDPAKYITGIRSHLTWENLDFTAFINYLSSYFKAVHVVSRRLYDIFAPALPSVKYVTHGVDTSFFTPAVVRNQSRGGVRVGWAGNRKSAADKGFSDIIEPLGAIPGVELVYCGYSDRNLSLSEMHTFYDSIDIYACASTSEGNNNPLMEAAAMERAIITTDNGTVPEYLRDGENALIVKREPAYFMEAVCTLRDDPARRLAMGREARKAVLNEWDWNDKAEDYRAFFREALNNIGQSPIPSELFELIRKANGTQLSEEAALLLKRANEAFRIGSRETAENMLRMCIERARIQHL